MSSLLLGPRRHFCLLSRPEKPLCFACCSCSQPSYLQIVWHFQWLPEVSILSLLHVLLPPVTAGANVRQHTSVRGSAGGFSCGLLLAWDCIWFWGTALSAWTERLVSALLCSRGYHEWMSSSWGFGSGELLSRYKADSGTQATRVGQVSYLIGRIFLAGRSSFAPVLCCDPSLQRIKAFLSLFSIV